MKIILHGAAQEVGKSCIEIITEGKRYIMDAGVKFTQHGAEYPLYLDQVYELDGVFLSHAHLDHSGALPLLEHKNLKCPIHCTTLTWKITNLLLQDSMHLEKLKHIHPVYTERDVNKIQNDLRFVNYNQAYTTPDGKVKFTFLNAGHIPGSASILLEIEGKKVLYTADYNTEKTLLMIESDLEKLTTPIDVLITENTYGDRPHPPRDEVETGLLKSINSCIREGGSVLIPVFSVGRSQEILLLLSKLETEHPIYLDGMPKKINDLVLKSNDPYVDNLDILAKMSKRVIPVVSQSMREEISRKKGVIIVSSSGMVQGGPVVTYAERMIRDENNFIILTGYQGKGTNGRFMFEDHMFYNHHNKEFVKAHVRKFDFSAHLGQESIRKVMMKIKPKNLILQHGDIEALVESKKFAEDNMKETKVFMPKAGEVMEF